MAPVAIPERDNVTTAPVKPVVTQRVFNPFYSPPSVDDGNESYKYADFKVDTSFLIPAVIYLELVSSFSLHSQNCLGSHWRKLKSLTEDYPPTLPKPIFSELRAKSHI
jgi:hypothetical protein